MARKNTMIPRTVVPRSVIGAGVVAACALLYNSRASDAEGPTPLHPGIETGIPLGALPPVGLYFDNGNYFFNGRVKSAGNKLPITVQQAAEGLTLTWASPYRLFGARYGAGITQPFVYQVVNATGVGGAKTYNFDLFNTILRPLILSWKLSDSLFLSTTQTICVKDGSFHAIIGERTQGSFANGY